MKHNKLIIGIVVALTFGLFYPSQAQESKFKALFIYKFAEYIEWPSGNKNVTVGVAGNSDVYQELSNFAATKGNMTVVNINAPADANKCNIVFLPKSQDKQISSYDSTIGGKSILVVSDNSDMVGKGSDIGFYLESGKLRFLISEKSIKNKKMIPSSKLLALGKSI
ncbi:YfiR family protein [Reichenbachiella carrageenanivorans]|uniref:YfiR family protein n=1 Tax=Reichenbachiella carrageenanivorans TaxID=2979869 RepID=A0ABY6D381_9BACT|nr:YfiR family protein [Reichenbachiella carrageenanivorans]UXX78290.1 YfiR family protein [Reichenbachiella carrageenanivorans]